MEEVYVIKLKGVPSSSATSYSSSGIDSHDIIRKSSLGLGILHLIFGVLVLVFGILKCTATDEPSATIFGTLFGPIFIATGVTAIVAFKRPYRTLKMKVLFVLSSLSIIGSVSFLSVCLVGVVYFHSTPRIMGDSARITANAIVATFGEFIVALLTVLMSGSAVWQIFHCGNMDSGVQHKPLKKKVIVKTNITGKGSNPDGGGLIDEEVIRHVSPNCIISLKASDEQMEVVRRVREYVRDLQSQGDTSLTFSEQSTSVSDEQDLGVDSQNWRNDVVSLPDEQKSEMEINEIYQV